MYKSLPDKVKGARRPKIAGSVNPRSREFKLTASLILIYQAYCIEKRSEKIYRFLSIRHVGSRRGGVNFLRLSASAFHRVFHRTVGNSAHISL